MKHSRRAGAIGAVTAVLATFCVLPLHSALAVPTPPPNPTDQQIQQKQNEKAALANRVGQLSANLASLQSQVQMLQAQQESAVEKLSYALSELDAAKARVADAQAAAQAAKVAVTQAEQTVKDAQRDYVLYAQAVYTGGQVQGTTGMLLTAQDPSALLETATLEKYQSAHQLGAIDAMQRATIGKSNADAKARSTVIAEKSAQVAQQKATDAAQHAKDAAVAATQAATAKQAQLQQQQVTTLAALDQAQNDLATLNNQRQAYVAWQARQAEIRRQAELKRQREEAARKAAELERQRREAAQNAASHSGSSTNSGSSGHSDSLPPPTGGSWTAAMGRKAVARAMTQLGETYIWAGGNRYGPTDGYCTDPIAPCGTLGFDCSGLSLYAWAPFVSLPHWTVRQYTEAGRYHPSPGNFMPGDLLFWGPGGIGSIHHVAIYIGNGNVIQAPQSGDIVRITPWDQVSWDYYGATRPLT